MYYDVITILRNPHLSLTFKYMYLLFGHLLQEANGTRYLGGALTGLPGYQISLASCTK